MKAKVICTISARLPVFDTQNLVLTIKDKFCTNCLKNNHLDSPLSFDLFCLTDRAVNRLDPFILQHLNLGLDRIRIE